MATVDLVMPKMGESIMEATILKWHKQPGDHVKMDETVLEIATDKVDSEVPSTAEGVLSEVLYNVNDVVPIGTVIARIKSGSGETEQHSPEPVFQPSHSSTTTIQQPKPATTVQHNNYQNNNNHNANRFYSPLVLNIAAQEGVSLTELEH